MKTSRHLLRLLTLLLASLLFPSGLAHSQTLIPRRLDRVGSNVAVRFDTGLGRVYRVEHSADLVNWTPYPDTIYGLGQTARYHVYDAPTPGQTVIPPSNEPQTSEHYFFMVTGFDDGSALAAWNGADGSPVRAYLPFFDLRYQGQVMQEVVRSAGMFDSGPAYDLEVWSWAAGVKPAGVTGIQTPVSELPTLQKLINSGAKDTILQIMYAAVDWRIAHPSTSLPETERPFDDRGQPTRQFFRSRSRAVS